MSFKRTLPYFLSSAAMLFIGAHTLGSNETESTQKVTYNIRPVPAPKINTEKSIDFAEAVTNNAIAIMAIAQKYDVVYTRADGNQFRRSGGTRAWRNNNPGCLRYSVFTASLGAIGEAGGFAVFPDEETGMKAISALLTSDKYRNLTISQAISKYAPPHENDTAEYNASLHRMTGLPITKKLSDLNDEQIMHVVKAIRIVEGWRPGKETFIQKNEKAKDSLELYAEIQQKQINKALERTM